MFIRLLRTNSLLTYMDVNNDAASPTSVQVNTFHPLRLYSAVETQLSASQFILSIAQVRSIGSAPSSTILLLPGLPP